MNQLYVTLITNIRLDIIFTKSWDFLNVSFFQNYRRYEALWTSLVLFDKEQKRSLNILFTLMFIWTPCIFINFEMYLTVFKIGLIKQRRVKFIMENWSWVEVEIFEYNGFYSRNKFIIWKLLQHNGQLSNMRL